MSIKETIGRSWQITKLSFGVIGKDKELLIYPLLSGFFSLLYSAALLVPRIIWIMIQEGVGEVEFQIVEYILVFATYLGLAFIATFFNVCTVYTAKMRFEGQNATIGSSLKFAFSKTWRIFQWSLLSATVGLLMYILDQLAQKAGKWGSILLIIVRNIVSIAWNIVTIFVVPVLVYHDVGPGDAIKKSVQTLKKTWGESLARHFGLGIMQAIFAFLVLVLGGILTVVLFMLIGPVGLFIGLGVTAVVFIILLLVFGLAHQIFNTALFVYADTGKVPGDYDANTMQNAFKQKDGQATPA